MDFSHPAGTSKGIAKKQLSFELSPIQRFLKLYAKNAEITRERGFCARLCRI